MYEVDKREMQNYPQMQENTIKSKKIGILK